MECICCLIKQFIGLFSNPSLTDQFFLPFRWLFTRVLPYQWGLWPVHLIRKSLACSWQANCLKERGFQDVFCKPQDHLQAECWFFRAIYFLHSALPINGGPPLLDWLLHSTKFLPIECLLQYRCFSWFTIALISS